MLFIGKVRNDGKALLRGNVQRPTCGASKALGCPRSDLLVSILTGGPGAPAPLFPSKWSRGLAPHAVTVPSKIAFAVAICVTCSLLRP